MKRALLIQSIFEITFLFSPIGAHTKQLQLIKMPQFQSVKSKTQPIFFLIIFLEFFSLQRWRKLQSNNQKLSSLMNSQQMSYFFLYCASQNYALFHPYGYPVMLPENNGHLSSSMVLSKDQESEGSGQKTSKQSSDGGSRRLSSCEASKRKEKKVQIIKKQEKDVEFKQRQQTTNRNLCSNTLKIYFKQLRDKFSETNLNLNKIIEANKIGMTAEEFIRKVDRAFPPSSTYISFDSVKKMCNHFFQETLDVDFAKILRTSMVRFYSYEIYAVNIKSIRTTRKIRNQQIKQGKVFLRELSL